MAWANMTVNIRSVLYGCWTGLSNKNRVLPFSRRSLSRIWDPDRRLWEAGWPSSCAPDPRLPSGGCPGRSTDLYPSPESTHPTWGIEAGQRATNNWIDTFFGPKISFFQIEGYNDIVLALYESTIINQILCQNLNFILNVNFCKFS